MSKSFKCVTILLVLLLVGCNRPQEIPKDLPDDTAVATEDVKVETSVPVETEVSTTTEPAESPTDTIPPEPVRPTVNMTQVLEGDVIPLLPAGTEITLLEITMVNHQIGWGIGIVDSETQHIFHTSDGGLTWQDITPPQPKITSDGEITNLEHGIWNKDTAWVAFGGTDYIWSTKNAGQTWEAAPVDYLTTYDGMFTVLDEDHAWFFQFLEGGMQKVFTALNRTSNGGDSWELLLEPHSDITIQSFDKTGAEFINPNYGWLTRDYRGVDPKVRINLTQDGGFTWESVEIPPPPGLPDVFNKGVGALYDPDVISAGEGSFRVFTRQFNNGDMIDQDFLYKTDNNGGSWDILEMPSGVLYYITDQVYYSISRDIHRSNDGGVTWQLIRSVNWDGQFSFVDPDTAWVIASDLSDWENPEYALVKTSDGGNSFSEIKPVLITSSSIR